MNYIGKLVCFKVPSDRIARSHYLSSCGQLALPEPPSFRSAVATTILTAYPKGGRTWAVRETAKPVKCSSGNVTPATDTYTVYRTADDGATADKVCSLRVTETGIGASFYQSYADRARNKQTLDDLTKLAVDGAAELRTTISNSTLATLFIKYAETHFDCVFLTGRGIFVPATALHGATWSYILDLHARTLGWKVATPLPLVDEDEANRAVAELLSSTFAGQYAMTMKRIGELSNDAAILRATEEGSRLLDKAKRLGTLLRTDLDEQVLDLARNIETGTIMNDIASLSMGLGDE